LFIAKIAEVLRRADADNRQRLHNEFNIYLTLEKAYQSGQLLAAMVHSKAMAWTFSFSIYVMAF
jgi:hypothetical protein